jgi:hypothetical protein
MGPVSLPIKPDYSEKGRVIRFPLPRWERVRERGVLKCNFL